MQVFSVMHISYLVETSSSAIKESDIKSSMSLDNRDYTIREYAVEEVADEQGLQGSGKINKQ